MMAGEYQDGDNFENKNDKGMEPESSLDPKAVQAYRKVGVVMRSFKSGKLPKAFKIIPQTANWEELLILTNPDFWSAHSHLEATKIFCSQLSEQKTQRFYNLVLLPGVQKNIA